MPRINLLPHRESKRKERKLKFLVALVSAASVGVVTAFAAYLMYGSMIDGQQHRNDMLRAQIKTLDKQIEEINDLESAKQKYIARMESLRQTLERAWVAVRALATAALIPAGAGKVVLIGPRPDAGPYAAAARAALENRARTLSLEWARYGVGTVAIAPGAHTRDDDLAELVCFLVSPAGEYFTGCVFELGLT